MDVAKFTASPGLSTAGEFIQTQTHFFFAHFFSSEFFRFEKLDQLYFRLFSPIWIHTYFCTHSRSSSICENSITVTFGSEFFGNRKWAISSKWQASNLIALELLDCCWLHERSKSTTCCSQICQGRKNVSPFRSYERFPVSEKFHFRPNISMQHLIFHRLKSFLHRMSLHVSFKSENRS